MQHQLAGREAVAKRAPKCPRLLGATAVTDGIVRITLERDVRELPRHPHIERIVQKQVRQKRRDDPTLRRPGRARHDAAVLHLHRSLQPALDVEQHPRTVRMTTNRLEHQLPINAVEETLDVEIENPIVAPAALASLAHGISCRFAGPVAVGVSVEHRLQDRLQIATGDLLGNAVGDRWNSQRPNTAICLRNLDPQYRRRKIAP